MRCCGSPARPAHTSSCGPSHCLVDTAQHAEERWVDGWMDGWMQDAGRRVTWIRGVATRSSEQQRAPASSTRQPANGLVPPCRWASHWGLAGVSLGPPLGLAAPWPGLAGQWLAVPYPTLTHARPHTSTRAWGRASNQQLANIRCVACKGNTHLSSSLPSTRQPSQRLSAAACNVISRIRRFHESTTAARPAHTHITPPPAAPFLTVQCPLATPEPSPLVASRPEPKLSLRRRTRAASLCPVHNTTRHDTPRRHGSTFGRVPAALPAQPTCSRQHPPRQTHTRSSTTCPRALVALTLSPIPSPRLGGIWAIALAPSIPLMGPL